MVARGTEENLRFQLQPAKRITVYNFVAVALEFGSQIAKRNGALSAACF
jgi:hypothetical protein